MILSIVRKLYGVDKQITKLLNGDLVNKPERMKWSVGSTNQKKKYEDSFGLGFVDQDSSLL